MSSVAGATGPTTGGKVEEAGLSQMQIIIIAVVVIFLVIIIIIVAVVTRKCCPGKASILVLIMKIQLHCVHV